MRAAETLDELQAVQVVDEMQAVQTLDEIQAVQTESFGAVALNCKLAGRYRWTKCRLCEFACTACISSKMIRMACISSIKIGALHSLNFVHL